MAQGCLIIAIAIPETLVKCRESIHVRARGRLRQYRWTRKKPWAALATVGASQRTVSAAVDSAVVPVDHQSGGERHTVGVYSYGSPMTGYVTKKHTWTCLTNNHHRIEPTVIISYSKQA